MLSLSFWSTNMAARRIVLLAIYRHIGSSYETMFTLFLLCCFEVWLYCGLTVMLYQGACTWRRVLNSFLLFVWCSVPLCCCCSLVKLEAVQKKSLQSHTYDPSLYIHPHSHHHIITILHVLLSLHPSLVCLPKQFFPVSVKLYLLHPPPPFFRHAFSSHCRWPLGDLEPKQSQYLGN